MKSKNKEGFKEQVPADLPPELKKFRETWEKLGDTERLNTLLNMTMSIAYRMDILASVVSGIPAVKDMENAVKDKIKEEQTKNGTK